MQKLTFNQKRCIAAAGLALLVLSVANELFGWGLFGLEPKRLRAGVVVVLAVLIARYGNGLYQDTLAFAAERKRKLEEAEHGSVIDPAEVSRIQEGIGMTPN